MGKREQVLDISIDGQLSPVKAKNITILPCHRKRYFKSFKPS
jgi:hypothetical protein